MSRGRGRRDNELIGQTVRISQGPYKGDLQRPCGGLGRGMMKESPIQFDLLSTRLHWRGEGCHGVYGPSGTAFYLPDHLCRPSAAYHSVRAGAGQAGLGMGYRGAKPTHSTSCLCPQGLTAPGWHELNLWADAHVWLPDTHVWFWLPHTHVWLPDTSSGW